MKRRNLQESFYFALRGMGYAIITQPNMRYHILVAILALIFGFIFEISVVKKLLVMFAIFLVLITEMINTAIESTVDLYTREQKQLAAIAKDVAAGAVMFASLNAALVGYFVFFDSVNKLGFNILMWGTKQPIILLTTVLILIIVISALIDQRCMLVKGSKLANLNHKELITFKASSVLVGVVFVLIYFAFNHLVLAFLAAVVSFITAVKVFKLHEHYIILYQWVIIGINFGILVLAII